MYSIICVSSWSSPSPSRLLMFIQSFSPKLIFYGRKLSNGSAILSNAEEAEFIPRHPFCSAGVHFAGDFWLPALKLSFQSDFLAKAQVNSLDFRHPLASPIINSLTWALTEQLHCSHHPQYITPRSSPRQHFAGCTHEPTWCKPFHTSNVIPIVFTPK